MDLFFHLGWCYNRVQFFLHCFHLPCNDWARCKKTWRSALWHILLCAKVHCLLKVSGTDRRHIWWLYIPLRSNMCLIIHWYFCRDSSTHVRSLRPGTTSSMATYNETSDDSTLHQISSCVNVSIGQSDAFTLPGVALKASTNCTINDSLYNSMLGGDITSLPGMRNFVVPGPSSRPNIDRDVSQNASANVSANFGRGGTLDINASSSASSGSRNSSRKAKNVSSKINHGCINGCQDNKQTMNAQSSVNIAMSPNRVSPSDDSRDSTPQIGEIHANATVVSTRGERSCPSNAEVILRPENVRRSRQHSMAWQRAMNSKLVKNLTRLSLGHLTKTYYAPLLQKTAAKVRYVVEAAFITVQY